MGLLGSDHSWGSLVPYEPHWSYYRALALDFIATWKWNLFYSCWPVSIGHDQQQGNGFFCIRGNKEAECGFTTALPGALTSCLGIPSFALSFPTLFWRSEKPLSKVQLYFPNQSQNLGPGDVQAGFGLIMVNYGPIHLFCTFSPTVKYALTTWRVNWNRLFPNLCFPSFVLFLISVWDEPMSLKRTRDRQMSK